MKLNLFYVILAFSILLFSVDCKTTVNIENEEAAVATNDSVSSDRNGLRIWTWDKLLLPSSPWEDETMLGDHLNVDSAYDPEAVSLDGNQIRFYLSPSNNTADAEQHTSFNYRAEIHTAPWPAEHSLGTEQWIGWKYTFGDDYIIDTTSPITIFQNHPGVNGLSPQLELEIAALDNPSPALGGEIQIINEPSSDRIVTPVKPLAGDELEVVIHIIYGLEETGLFQVWLNGELHYNKNTTTVYPEHPWGGNNKWGIYHHTFNNSAANVQSSLEIGAGNMELFMGRLKLLTRKKSHPEYGINAYDLVRPKN